MAVIFDLDLDDGTSLPPVSHGAHASDLPLLQPMKPLHHSLALPSATTTEALVEEDSSRLNPNMNGFSATLSCYPIVRQLASQLDLNTLHNLSRTCRQFRANLLEYRDQLVRRTLHCENESKGGEARGERRLTTGRVGLCARDMVGECSRCASVVCRNCTTKPPPRPILRARHRRLCRTCTKAPLSLLLTCPKPRSSSCDTPPPSSSPTPCPNYFGSYNIRTFTTQAFERTPCSCDSVVWLCAPCGKDLRNADTLYVRGWSWRTRYSHYLGGVGTGAGEGNEGVECGRGQACLGARIVEHETCEQDVLDAIESTWVDCTLESPERWKGSSYLAQEVEGIGGVLKVKHKKQVKVGECVKLYEDEKEKSIHHLEREVKGQLRSWCSWCERVVLGDEDKA